MTLKDKESVTARGSPSGMATTIIAIHRTMLWKISFHIPDQIELLSIQYQQGIPVWFDNEYLNHFVHVFNQSKQGIEIIAEFSISSSLISGK